MKTLLKWTYILTSLVISSSYSWLYAQEYQPLEDLSEIANNYIIKKIPKQYTIESLETAKIDSRIKFKLCQQALTADIAGSFKVNNHYTVAIKCQQPMWTYYLPVKAKLLAPVVMAHTTILRGEYINAEMLDIVYQKITGQHRRYFKQIKDVAGKQAKRTIKSDTAITASQLQARFLVKRKQKVIIVAKNSRLMVKMKGIALSNGKMNDRVKIRNINSKKIIEGVVSAEGVVIVNF